VTGKDLDDTDRFERPREHNRRLFFAFWPDAEVQVAFAHAARKAVKASGGQPVPMKNIHLTLVFLGSVPESRLSGVMSAARRVASEFPREVLPIGFEFERLEHWEGAHVLCAVPSRETSGSAAASGATAATESAAASKVAAATESVTVSKVATATESAAADLSQRLRGELVAIGFSLDSKPFRAHVTLARKVKRADGELDMQPALWSFRDFALVESRTEPQGAVYRVLEHFTLAAP
jgi:RNA 2',3'-cyclic 3'-phosphodiesterase